MLWLVELDYTRWGSPSVDCRVHTPLLDLLGTRWPRYNSQTYKQRDTTHKNTHNRIQLTKLQTTGYNSQDYKQRDATHKTTNTEVQLTNPQTERWPRYNSQTYKQRDGRGTTHKPTNRDMAEIQLTNLQTKQRDGRDTTHKPNYKQPDTTHKTTNSRIQLTKLQTTIYKSQNYKQRYGRDTTHKLQTTWYNSQNYKKKEIQLTKLQTTGCNSQNYKQRHTTHNTTNNEIQLAKLQNKRDTIRLGASTGQNNSRTSTNTSTRTNHEYKYKNKCWIFKSTWVLVLVQVLWKILKYKY